MHCMLHVHRVCVTSLCLKRPRRHHLFCSQSVSISVHVLALLLDRWHGPETPDVCSLTTVWPAPAPIKYSISSARAIRCTTPSVPITSFAVSATRFPFTADLLLEIGVARTGRHHVQHLLDSSLPACRLYPLPVALLSHDQLKLAAAVCTFCLIYSLFIIKSPSTRPYSIHSRIQPGASIELRLFGLP
ncbi:hypothetical protein BCR44DRAFT_350907 [Catenaria anguillulae PL171]|uniref:Uncharacterized protein n=1 Tax=Catenaria anguillulae PL171 TaxID=765915 RepID=A0A1Y2H942_9FUNG|nr:hypothetical protein BCR44DRAFT_350907 [Catenaria anguillulae PL171]